jgi:predicted DNA-binding transcriptional regulator YafY
VVNVRAENPSRTVQRTGHAILRHLKQHPEGARKEDFAKHCGADGNTVSGPTVQRALDWLRNQCDAPIDYDARSNRWTLRDDAFTLPLFDPAPEDLAAVVFATAVIAPLADAALNDRLKRLVEDMDARVRERDDASDPEFRANALTATVTTAASVDPTVLRELIRAASKRALRLRYRSPWSNSETSHEFEPWQVRVHDGNFYVRGYSRTSARPITLRVSHVISIQVVDDAGALHPVPKGQRLWGEGDPAFGIDEDRPGVATIRVCGATARWIGAERWHEAQIDTWPEPGEVLERTVPYRSCREFARRLMLLGDGLESVSPPELCEEVKRHAASLANRLRVA